VASTASRRSRSASSSTVSAGSPPRPPANSTEAYLTAVLWGRLVVAGQRWRWCGAPPRAHRPAWAQVAAAATTTRPARRPVGQPPPGAQRRPMEAGHRVPWRDPPGRYGPRQTCYERFRRWQADGTRQRLLAHAQTRSDAVGRGRTGGLGAGGRRRCARPPACRGRPKRGTSSYLGSPVDADQALGRSRGGLLTASNHNQQGVRLTVTSDPRGRGRA